MSQDPTPTQSSPPAPAVGLHDVRKVFGDPTFGFVALEGVRLDIQDNEFFTLLGPSGCGKTTLLRMIAGFEATTSGEIYLYGEEIEALPPDKRPVNTVFQNYALFPHMNVRDNIGFGLKMLGWAKADITARVNEMIAMVKLDEFAARRPAQLSGGQQQRVALARAMAPRPKVLLLDEPLSALDLKLRQEMRAELKRLQQETGITFIFVTHDQEEALTMSDRIAVMSAGEVQQIGTPAEIYDDPANRFVADFIGETNLIEAEVTAVNGDHITCRLAGGQELAAMAHGANIGTNGWLSIRPERIDYADQGLQGTVAESVYLGTDTVNRVTLDGGLTLAVRSQNALASPPRNAHDPVYLEIAAGAARFLTD
ncbi:MAG: ABC transporter ATP-binding protein [Pseudomonadota bacterium]